MGAPPDHVSTEQLLLKLNWVHEDIPRVSSVRFIVLHSDNVQIILGLNAILHGGFLEPLFDVLGHMRVQGSGASLMSLQEVEETTYLCMRRHTSARSRRVIQDPEVNDGDPSPKPGPVQRRGMARVRDPVPTTVPWSPNQEQHVVDPVFQPSNCVVGKRYRMLCPLANIPPMQLARSPELMTAHDDELRRYLNGNQYSFGLRVAPFYYFDERGMILELPLTPATCIQNVNGRYVVHHNMLVWQWGVYYGSGPNVQILPLASEQQALRSIHPIPERTQAQQPFPAARIALANSATYPAERQRRLDELHTTCRARDRARPLVTGEYDALVAEWDNEEAPRFRKEQSEKKAKQLGQQKRKADQSLTTIPASQSIVLRCTDCGGFLPLDMKDASACPHCHMVPKIADDPPPSLPIRRDPPTNDDQGGTNPTSLSFATPASHSRMTSSSSTSRPPDSSSPSGSRQTPLNNARAPTRFQPTYLARMIFDDEELLYQERFHSALPTQVIQTPNTSLRASHEPPARRPQPTLLSATGGGGEKESPGAAQPKAKVKLGHLLMMIEKGDIPKGDLRDPWTVPLLETPPEELEEYLGAYVDMDDFLTKSHEELYETFLKLFDTHVDQEFAAATPILALLRTKKAREVFVPAWKEWTGVNGIDDVELQYREDMPETMAARARPIQPTVAEAASKLWSRMTSYNFVESKSPCASPIVIAPKATAPFWRICGDYRSINKYIIVPQDVIPNVRKELEKTKGFNIFADLDLANAFHQLRLAPYTAQRLAVATPWGLYEPRFLPEGVGPASGILQKAMDDVFKDFKEWMIVIFDNLLVLARDFQDLYEKMVKVIDRCHERHVILKMEKSWIGVRTASFFGYEVSGGGYRLSQKRKDSIAAIPMPKDQKGMQRFLGAALYFKTHIPNYSDLTADLNDMTHKNFCWDEATWSKDYRGAMERLKEAVMKSATLHFPDYTLPWTLRCDASMVACGGTLLQIREASDGKSWILEVIAFVSKKFSGAAQRWDIPKKEAYAIFFSVHELAYYLEIKEFVIETDHSNLQWIEKAEAAIVVRWRLYLQNFAFKIRHIPGKANVFADMLSRMYVTWQDHGNYGEAPEAIEPLVTPLVINTLFMGDTEHFAVLPPMPECVRRAHVWNRKHCGYRETRKHLNDLFPGHRIPYRFVIDFVSACPVCQKAKRGLLEMDTVQPLVKNLKPSHRRSRVGVDTFHCSPPDKAGHVCVHVVVNHFTNFAALYPSKDHTAVGMAQALFNFFITYGIYDEIASDPGSNLTAEITEELIRLFGMDHRFGLVGVHTSSGVEGTNSLVLSHLRCICHDKRFRDRWGSPEVIGLVQFIINDSVCGETGIRRFDNMFGSEQGTYFKLPPALCESEKSHVYLRLLDEDLQRLLELSRQAHLEVIAKRRTPVTEATQNIYSPGDLVLVQRDLDKPLPTKLSLPFVGPHEVLSHEGNTVKCRHLGTHQVTDYPSYRVKIFHGSLEDAKKSAEEDYDQSLVRAITAWKGDPMVKTTMSFRVEFADGDVVWLPYSKDLDETQAFGEYTKSLPALEHLSCGPKRAKEWLTEMKRATISGYKVGAELYVDIRTYGTGWYDNESTIGST